MFSMYLNKKKKIQKDMFGKNRNMLMPIAEKVLLPF